MSLSLSLASAIYFMYIFGDATMPTGSFDSRREEEGGIRGGENGLMNTRGRDSAVGAYQFSWYEKK